MTKNTTITLDVKTKQKLDYAGHKTDSYEKIIDDLIKTSELHKKYFGCDFMMNKKKFVKLFSEDETKLLVDLLNGILYSVDIDPRYCLVAGIEDGCELNGIDKKWEVNKDELIKKIKQLGWFEAFSVIVAIDQWWEANPFSLDADFSTVFGEAN